MAEQGTARRDKTRFNDLPTLTPQRILARIPQSFSDRLHLHRMRPHFHLPTFWVTRALRSHRTVPANQSP
jgi:hypothetical protein